MVSYSPASVSPSPHTVPPVPSERVSVSLSPLLTLSRRPPVPFWGFHLSVSAPFHSVPETWFWNKPSPGVHPAVTPLIVSPLSPASQTWFCLLAPPGPCVLRGFTLRLPASLRLYLFSPPPFLLPQPGFSRPVSLREALCSAILCHRSPRPPPSLWAHKPLALSCASCPQPSPQSFPPGRWVPAGGRRGRTSGGSAQPWDPGREVSWSRVLSSPTPGPQSGIRPPQRPGRA